MKNENQSLLVKYGPTLMKLSSDISPVLSTPLILKAFCYPGPKKKTRSEKLVGGYKFRMVCFESKKIATWSWEAESSKLGRVLLVHGWGGFSYQMVKFVEPLLAQGYSVTMYDQPAHGHSEGVTTTLPEWTRLLSVLKKEFPDVRSVISHSFGSLAVAYQNSLGFELESFVSIGAPSSPTRMVEVFVKKLKLNPRLKSMLIKTVESQEQIEFEDFELQHFGSDVHVPTFVLHDKDDLFVSVEEAVTWQTNLRKTKVHFTNGLGHHAILKDRLVIGLILDHLNLHSSQF